MCCSSSITREQFEDGCKELILDVKASSLNQDFIDTIYQGWSWKEHPLVPGRGFLVRSLSTTNVKLKPCSEAEDEFTGIRAPDDEASLIIGDYLTVNICQYVVYSVTFQVPALYFIIHRSNGSPLSLDELLQLSLLRDDLFSIKKSGIALQTEGVDCPLLTQGDHPVLDIPCWHIHPCETPDVMRELLSHSCKIGVEKVDVKSWMRLWFMVLNNVINLRYP